MAYDASKEVRNLSVEQKVNLLKYVYAKNSPLTEGAKRFVLGGMYFAPASEPVIVSKNAFTLIQKDSPKIIVDGKVYLKSQCVKGCVIEHSVPISVVHKYVKSLVAGGCLNIDDELKNVLGKCKISLITTDENKKLNKTLKDKLPTDDDSWTKRPDCYRERYKKMGIEIRK